MGALSAAFTAWQGWLAELIAIVDDAGAQARRLFEAQARGEDVGLVSKQDASPLTAADRLAHEIITSRLARLTPDLPVVSEEDAAPSDARSAAGLWWLVDPLDGTREFVAGHPEFTINIGLVRADSPVFGIVSAPMLGQCYWGAPGQGAWVQDARGRRSIRCALLPARTADGRYERPLRILASRQHLTAATQAWIAQQRPHELARYGSSLKFCRIAEGEGDCYPRLGPTAPWDTAAAQAVVEGAGGQVLTADGRPLRYDGTRALNPDFLVIGDPSRCAPPPGL